MRVLIWFSAVYVALEVMQIVLILAVFDSIVGRSLSSD